MSYADEVDRQKTLELADDASGEVELDDDEPVLVTCPACRGEGCEPNPRARSADELDDCRTCGGTGEVSA